MVTWAPSDAATKTHFIRARVTGSSEMAECTAQVTVTDSLTRGSDERLIAIRSLLVPDAKEGPGYGLYSYVLLNGRPKSKGERDGAEALLESFVLISPSDSIEKYHSDRSELNATYVPIGSPLPDDFEQRDDKGAWLRNHYDFERALALLLRLRAVDRDQGFPGGGIWIVSCLHPLSGSEDPRPILIQDLTAVPPRLIPVWMNAFRALTTQPRFYDRRSFTKLSLDLRIVIGQLADGLEPVASAFKWLGVGLAN
jgi:hypothetical protein